MKRAIIISIAAFLSGYAMEAQTPNELIRPGDILTVKVLWPPKWGSKPLVTKTVVVKPDGGLALPRIQGMRQAGDINVGGLGLTQAGQRVSRNYAGTLEVVIERGTLDQLFSQ